MLRCAFQFVNFRAPLRANCGFAITCTNGRFPAKWAQNSYTLADFPLPSFPPQSRLSADCSFADNHRLAADPNLLENSCPDRERNMNTTRPAHPDALQVYKP